MSDGLYDELKLLKQNFINKNLEKEFVIAVLGRLVLQFDFIDILERFLKEDVIRRDTIGIVYSDEFESYEEEYFGENKVLFYYGVDEDWEDIVTHKELCEYLQTACEFYIERHPDHTVEVEKLLVKIKEKYNIKD
ncbi:ribonuclease toxin immunity protein CdiI [Bacillus sp. UNC322MFChir4.1]|uniref:ribonuclease toxin immunity protein CdiI n=1 Tax=Bacillus sp. UNC322MFChir4.1 TaxID=1449045 RepID=UPI00054E8919|nr:ribonuclease toxin immunity protein CdiI [Bacillus sp. UNC322MFChir4.1]